MEVYIKLDRQEIQNQIPYSIIAETTSGSRWNTGKRKRLYDQTFVKQEREAIPRLVKQAYNWALVKGAPDSVVLLPKTLSLWQKLGNFCYEL